MNVLVLCVILMAANSTCDNSNNTTAKLKTHDVNTVIQRGAGIIPPKKRGEN